MSTRMTVLIDDTSSKSGLLHEHGFSCALKLPNGEKWLWDTGSTDKFLQNAKTLGFQPSEFKALALSHGHYDHTGGIVPLYKAGFTGPTYAHPEYCRDRYHVEEGKESRFIGLPPFTELDPMPKVHRVQGIHQLAPGMRMVTDIPRIKGNAQNINNFYVDPQGTTVDPVPDDSCLLLDTASGTVLLLGCCHSGMANVLTYVQEQAGVTKLHALVGGTHLLEASEEELDQAAKALTSLSVERVFPGHCSGQHGLAGLAKRLGDKVQGIGAGWSHHF